MFPHVRIARPVTDLERSVRAYVQGPGFLLLDRFEDHAGFDGAMLGHPALAFHFEFTHCRHGRVTPSPTPEDLVVLYLPDPDEWAGTCVRMIDAGFVPKPSFNPFWARRGRTFSDPDGYRVVIENAGWPSATSRGAPG